VASQRGRSTLQTDVADWEARAAIRFVIDDGPLAATDFKRRMLRAETT
jgi:hypothetical protein